VKLWIIYKEGIGFSRIVAEMLQDRLEDYIEVSVGNAKKIDPAFLVEEKLDYLIIGDVINEVIPNFDIKNWLLKYWEIAKKYNLILKAISGFYVALTDNMVKPSWVEFLQDNLDAEIIHPPLLRLKLNRRELALEDGALELIKDHSNAFIELFFSNTN
jgi:hypothetical protein